MTFERQPKQPQEMTEMSNELPTIECIETLAYNVKYTASDAACHEMLCDAVMRRIVPAEIALDIAEQYAVRSFTESTANDLKEELDRLDAIEREDNPGCDLPQETSEQRTEIDDLLDEIEFATLLPGDAIYYDGDDWFIGNDGCQQSDTICLVATDTQCELVSELGQWVRHDALDAIRSLHERLATV